MAAKLIKLIWPWHPAHRSTPAAAFPSDVDTSVPPPIITDWHTAARRS